MANRLTDPAASGSGRCVACRKEIESGAMKCEQCGSFQGRPCAVCGQRLPVGDEDAARALKCTACSSHQRKWRRGIGFGNSTLALLTALLAVASVALPVLFRTLFPVSVGYLGTSTDAKFLLISVMNRSPHAAFLKSASLRGDFEDREEVDLLIYDPETEKHIPAEEFLVLPGTKVLHLKPKTFTAVDENTPDPHFELRHSWAFGGRVTSGREVVSDLEVLLEFWNGNQSGGDP